MPPLGPGEGNLLKTDSCTSQETKVLFPVCTVTLLFNIWAVSGPPLPHFLSLTFFQSVLTRNILKLQNTISYMLVLLLQNKDDLQHTMIVCTENYGKQELAGSSQMCF